MPLSHRRQLFVDQYLIDSNATQAAIRAGYSPKTARQQGSRLLSSVAVSTALRAGIERVTDGVVKSATFVYDGLVKEAEDMDSAPRDRIRALELVGKLRGEFHTKTETHVTHEHVATLSDSQLARMEAIYREPIEGTARMLSDG